jgi:hypothetical protein
VLLLTLLLKFNFHGLDSQSAPVIGVCDLVAPAEKEDSGFRIPIPVPVPVPVLIINKTTRDVSSLLGSNLRLQLKQKSLKCQT